MKKGIRSTGEVKVVMVVRDCSNGDGRVLDLAARVNDAVFSSFLASFAGLRSREMNVDRAAANVIRG